jgi:hypothetical protein
VWLERDRHLDPCLRDSAFQRLIDIAMRHHDATLRAFRAAGGDEILAAA